MSGYTDDVETYLWLCEHYKVPVQYNESGIPDVYGHGAELWARYNQEGLM